MPMYSYHCLECDSLEEHLMKKDEKDNVIPCARCGVTLKRSGVEAFALGKEAYQMKAIMGDGSHVKGHFGKDAKRDRFKRNKKG